MNAPENDNPADDQLLVVTTRIQIPKEEFRFTFVRSSGPGGQNVNKVSTKARLHWMVVDSPSLDEAVKQRFLQKYRRRISTDGEFQLTSQRFRDQSRNVDDCLEKLRVMLAEVAVAPKPRKKTKPSRASRQRRLAEKRRQSARKQLRRRPTDE